jgi:hypothetical protein
MNEDTLGKFTYATACSPSDLELAHLKKREDRDKLYVMELERAITSCLYEVQSRCKEGHWVMRAKLINREMQSALLVIDCNQLPVDMSDWDNPDCRMDVR